jgi:hypothetical protein
MKTLVEVGRMTVGMRAFAIRLRRGGSIALGCLLASMLFAGLPAAASAATEMRGEWQLVLTSGGRSVKAIAIISQEASSSGEFASSSMRIEGVDPGTFTGTLHGTEASVKVTNQAYGPVPESEFTSTTMAVQSSGSSLSLSGSGTISSGGTTASGTLTATRIRTYKEIEEQEEREKREREEAEARENVRGEWSLTLKSGAQTAQGVARITEVANTKNEFASSSALFEGAVPGSFSGTLEGSKATVTITTQAVDPIPASTFTSSSIVVTSSASAMSMSGSGTLSAGGASAPATLTATRIKTYLQLKELEAEEKLEREAKEREAREAKEAQERLEREAREKRAKEEALKQSAPPPTQTSSSSSGGGSVTISAQPASKTLMVSASGSLALQLTNPNVFAVQGRLTLVLASSGHAGRAAATKGKRGKRTPLLLGASSFAITANGHVTVRIKLSKAGWAELARHKTLAAVATIVTQASGKSRVSKTFKLTLHAPAPVVHHHRH